MTEVMRWKLKGFVPGVEGVSKALFQPWVVQAEDFDNATRLFLDAAERCVAAERREKELQQRLTAADERADLLEGLLRDARHYHGVMLFTDPPQDAWKHHCISERIDAALKPASCSGLVKLRLDGTLSNDIPTGQSGHISIGRLDPEPNRIKGMIETVGGEYAVMIDQANRHYGWTFKKHPDGQWVSGRLATEAEMNAARAHAQITNQL